MKSGLAPLGRIRQTRLWLYARVKRQRVNIKLANIAKFPQLKSPVAALRYLLFDREIDNFTYPIANGDEIAALIARFTAVEPSVIRGYMDELANDSQLHQELQARQKRPAHFGRRLGWYALIRAMQPQTVVEAGVHDGLGATAILAALERNGSGRLFGMDFTDRAGWLIPDRLKDRYEQIAGDIAEMLPSLCGSHRIDLFIHDSDHSYAFEQMEYGVLTSTQHGMCVVLSDSAWPDGTEDGPCPLSALAAQVGQPYEYCHEVSEGHFYPGAGIGLTQLPPRA